MLKALAIVATLSGCSIALQSKPKPGRTSAQSGCSTSHAYLVADAVGVAAGVVAMAYAVAKRGEDTAIVGGPAAIGSVLYLASAGNGYRWRRACESSAPAQTAAR